MFHSVEKFIRKKKTGLGEEKNDVSSFTFHHPVNRYEP